MISALVETHDRASLRRVFYLFSFSNLFITFVAGFIFNNVKKVIRLSFLLLATIALLAHATIPHHHHAEEPEAICLALHAHSEEDHPENEVPPTAGMENCLLNGVYTKADGQPPVVRLLNETHTPDACLLFLCPDCGIAKVAAPTGSPVRHKPYLPFVPAEYIARSVGLRAPPVC